MNQVQHLPAVIKRRISEAKYPASYNQAVETLKKATQDLRKLDSLSEVKDGMERSDIIAGYAKAIKSKELETDVSIFKNECWNRIGELCLEIPHVRAIRRKSGYGCDPNPGSRTSLLAEAGIPGQKASVAMRLASLPEVEKRKFIESGKSFSRLKIELPRRGVGVGIHNFSASALYKDIFDHLSRLASFCRRQSAISAARQMTFDESLRLSRVIREVTEYLDEFDQHLKVVNGN